MYCVEQPAAQVKTPIHVIASSYEHPSVGWQTVLQLLSNLFLLNSSYSNKYFRSVFKIYYSILKTAPKNPSNLP